MVKKRAKFNKPEGETLVSALVNDRVGNDVKKIPIADRDVSNAAQPKRVLMATNSRDHRVAQDMNQAKMNTGHVNQQSEAKQLGETSNEGTT